MFIYKNLGKSLRVRNEFLFCNRHEHSGSSESIALDVPANLIAYLTPVCILYKRLGLFEHMEYWLINMRRYIQ